MTFILLFFVKNFKNSISVQCTSGSGGYIVISIYIHIFSFSDERFREPMGVK